MLALVMVMVGMLAIAVIIAGIQRLAYKEGLVRDTTTNRGRATRKSRYGRDS